MRNLFTLHQNYTLWGDGYQVLLPLDLGYLIPAADEVRLLGQFIERMFSGDLYRTYCREGHKGEPTPHQMLKVLLYAYMNHIYPSREIEKACRRDINFMWPLEGAKVPDHATMARSRTLHFAPCADRIMAESSGFLYGPGEISGEAIFIDGTKIEACANKYTFVWKKAVSKNQQKPLEKLAEFVGECETLYGLKITYKKQVKTKHVKKLRKKLYALKEPEGVGFVHGPGKRKSPLQKGLETLEGYLKKLKEYTKKLYACGERGIYSRTDPDATFMRMEEDAMGNGRLKAGYNVQHGVGSEYIVWLEVGPQPADTTTLIPFLMEMEKSLPFHYTKVVADAGYESEENYHYPDGKGQQSFIKPADYEKPKTRKYKKDIGRACNMEYHRESDTYTCHNGKTLEAVRVKTGRAKAGYERETTIYTCQGCGGCPYKKECIKGNHSNTPLEERSKNLYVSKKFVQYQTEDLERITSEEGCELRMNRSIQVGVPLGISSRTWDLGGSCAVARRT